MALEEHVNGIAALHQLACAAREDGALSSGTLSQIEAELARHQSALRGLLWSVMAGASAHHHKARLPIKSSQ